MTSLYIFYLDISSSSSFCYKSEHLQIFILFNFMFESVCMSVCPAELRGCYAIEVCACIPGPEKKNCQWHRGLREEEEEEKVEEAGGGIQPVSAHRPFPIRQTQTFKHSHTCIRLCLGWGARTPTTL